MNYFIFTSCTTNSMVTQTANPPSNINIGNILKNNLNQCYNYVGQFTNYIPPSGFIVANVNMFTATTQTTFSSCVECLVPTPVVLPYIEWKGKAGFTLSCPVCELTDFGGDHIWYTSSGDTILKTGIYIYGDSNLTTPPYVSFIKVKTKQNVNQFEEIFEVDNMGKITFKCKVNENC